jgi:hypothetical protein
MQRWRWTWLEVSLSKSVQAQAERRFTPKATQAPERDFRLDNRDAFLRGAKGKTPGRRGQRSELPRPYFPQYAAPLLYWRGYILACQHRGMSAG